MEPSPPPSPRQEPKGHRNRRGSEVRQKQHRTSTRWNDTDYAALLANVERAGVTMGTYIRSSALGSPTTSARRRSSVELQALAKALAMVNKMGGNLHQIARHLNFGGVLEPGELRMALVGYEAMVAAIMAAMGMQP
jgi:hypothetical protein